MPGTTHTWTNKLKHFIINDNIERQKIEEKTFKFLFAVKIHVDVGCWTFPNWLKVFLLQGEIMLNIYLTQVRFVNRVVLNRQEREGDTQIKNLNEISFCFSCHPSGDMCAFRICIIESFKSPIFCFFLRLHYSYKSSLRDRPSNACKGNCR